MIISLDTESTGLDLYHGARPFLVTVCTSEGENLVWEWHVDPLTRKVQPVEEDLLDIGTLLRKVDGIALQNTKYDVTGLTLLFRDCGLELRWPWYKTVDTLMGGHLLASNHPHDLASMAVEYLAVRIDKYEKRLERIVKKARDYARKHRPEWRIAKEGLPEMPSAKAKVWKYDTWLPKTVSMQRETEFSEEWWTTCEEYANMDSAVTLAIWLKQKEVIEERGLWKIYQERLKLLPVIYKMEERGVTLSKKRLKKLTARYAQDSERLGKTCVKIAKSYGADLKLPKSGNNKSLVSTVFEQMGLEPIAYSSKTGKPSLDADTLEYWQATLPQRSKKLKFVETLAQKRKCDTAITYMESYERYWLPVIPRKGWYRLHPGLNVTGADTLRWSSSRPNEQNISRKEGFNLRYCFGPVPKREWWSMDAQNIELRIPAFESGEEDLMWVFNHPEEPPYYGSYHLVVAEALHPKLFKRFGADFKKEFAATWYQWVKNGNFAVIYGAQEEKADLTYKVPGAYKKIRDRFPKIAALSDRQVKLAEQRGYVETMPDKNVCPERGYPLLCARGRYGRVKPTVPFNYHIQSTAMWWMSKAMIRIQPLLDQWTQEDKRGYYVIMQIHDELVFDFPKGHTYKSSLPKIKKIKRLMELGGDDIGIPTPVGVDYHPETWDQGETIKLTS